MFRPPIYLIDLVGARSRARHIYKQKEVCHRVEEDSTFPSGVGVHHPEASLGER